jgi:GPH family glycoside/pentoside/hexuronide:cation symporter/glucuronide carrier protein
MSRSFLFSLVGMLPVMMIVPFLANRFGKRPVYVTGLAISAVFPLLRLFSLTNIPLLYAAFTFSGIGGGLAMALRYGIQADNVDYIEYVRKQRAEGVVSALQSFVMKAGMGLGGAIPGYILAATGYAPNQPQTDAAKTGIVASVIIIPAFVYLASLLVFGIGYNLNKEKLAEITQSLRAERTAKKAAGR